MVKWLLHRVKWCARKGRYLNAMTLLEKASITLTEQVSDEPQHYSDTIGASIWSFSTFRYFTESHLSEKPFAFQLSNTSTTISFSQMGLSVSSLPLQSGQTAK